MNGLHPSFPILEVPFFRAGIAVSGVNSSARCLDRRYFFISFLPVKISYQSRDAQMIGKRWLDFELPSKTRDVVRIVRKNRLEVVVENAAQRVDLRGERMFQANAPGPLTSWPCTRRSTTILHLYERPDTWVTVVGRGERI
jgi:hypothetical protein